MKAAFLFCASFTFLLPFIAHSQRCGDVLPPERKVDGLTRSEWSVLWWQWAYDTPTTNDDHPLLQTKGPNTTVLVDCGAFQPPHRNVWFLGGSFTAVDTTPGGSDVAVLEFVARRSCTMTGPRKTLLVPAVNAECSSLTGNGDDYAALSSCAADLISQVTSVFLSVDGVLVPNPSSYIAASPLYTYGPLPADNLYGDTSLAGQTSLSVSDGYWFFIGPMTPGLHVIRFGGTVVSSTYRLTFDTEYDITVGHD